MHLGVFWGYPIFRYSGSLKIPSLSLDFNDSRNEVSINFVGVNISK